MTCKGCERHNQMMEMDIESAIDEQLSMELRLLRALPGQSAGQTLPFGEVVNPSVSGTAFASALIKTGIAAGLLVAFLVSWCEIRIKKWMK